MTVYVDNAAFAWRGRRWAHLMADDLADHDCVSDETWAALRSDWDEQQIIELIVTAGFYRLVSGFLNSAGVQLDEGVPGFPSTS